MSVDFTPWLPLAVDLGWALIHLLWQGVVIAAVLEVALVVAGRRNARVRYLLCAVALAAMPVCFAVTLQQMTHGAPAAVTGTIAATASGRPATLEPTPAMQPLESRPDAEFARHVWPAQDWNQVIPLVTSAWLAGVVLLSGRKAGGFYLVWRWRHRGIAEPDGAMMELFAGACGKMGIDPRRVGLKISALVRVPMTMGWWRPVVLFPVCLLSGLGGDEIELLLAHELAHIRRWDYLANLLQAGVETLFFHHPLTWWMSRRLRQERENCCDDLVVRSPAETLAYAKALLQLETMRPPAAELVAAASGGVLRRRIERLLSVPTPGIAGGFSILLLVLFLGMAAVVSLARAQDPAFRRAASAVVVTATKEVVGDTGRLYHAMVYTQTSAEAPLPASVSWQFIADIANNAFPVRAGTVALPAGSAWTTNPVAVVMPELLVGAHYLYVQGFKSEAQLMASFPNGTYAFNIQPGLSGATAYAAPVSFTGAAKYPPTAPVVTNTTWDAGALVMDPASAIIHFTNYPGATLTWEILIPGKTYIMSAGGEEMSGGALNLTGLLGPGQTYVAQLRFINRDKSSTVSDPAAPKDYAYATMMAQIVEFTIKTPAEHATTAPAAKPDGIAAMVDGHAITEVEIQQDSQTTDHALETNLHGDELKASILKTRKDALQTRIDRRLIVDEFKGMGGSIPDSFLNARVDDEIKYRYGGDRSAFLKDLASQGITLEQDREKIGDNATIAYMRGKNVSEKVREYYDAHHDLFPADVNVNMTVMEIIGSQPVPPGQTGSFATDTDPQAKVVRDVLAKMRAGADVSNMAKSEDVDPRAIGEPHWYSDDGGLEPLPSNWPFTWAEVEKMNSGQTTDIAVVDSNPTEDSTVPRNQHEYWMLRVNEREPLRVVATPEATQQDRARFKAETKRLQDAWLGSLRAKAQIQIFDPALTSTQ